MNLAWAGLQVVLPAAALWLLLGVSREYFLGIWVGRRTAVVRACPQPQRLGQDYRSAATLVDSSDSVKALADVGQTPEAVKLPESQNGLGLQAAKNAVESYVGKRDGLRQRRTKPRTGARDPAFWKWEPNCRVPGGGWRWTNCWAACVGREGTRWRLDAASRWRAGRSHEGCDAQPPCDGGTRHARGGPWKTGPDRDSAGLGSAVRRVERPVDPGSPARLGAGVFPAWQRFQGANRSSGSPVARTSLQALRAGVPGPAWRSAPKRPTASSHDATPQPAFAARSWCAARRALVDAERRGDRRLSNP